MKILIIESDDVIVGQLELVLRSTSDVKTEVAVGGEDALELLAVYTYDLVIIGDNLCDMDADALLKRMRRGGHVVPVIIFSHEGDTDRKVRLLHGGADDYIQQPADRYEIAARCLAVSRRSKGLAENLVRVGPISVNLHTREVRVDGELVHMTGTEVGVLSSLATRSGRTVSKEQIMSDLYGNDPGDAPESKIVDVYICKLRNKLRRHAAAGHLETVHGQGYRLRPDDVGDPALKSEANTAQRMRVLEHLLAHPEGSTISQIEIGLKETLPAYWSVLLIAQKFVETDMMLSERGQSVRIYLITPAGAAHLARHQQQAA